MTGPDAALGHVDGWAVRAERPADHVTVGEVVRAAFGSDVEVVLVERLRASDRYEPDLALVAELDGVVVGFVQVTWVDLRNDTTAATRRVLSLSPLAVHPDHQGVGIGSALVREAIARSDALGEPLLVLEGNPAYYGRFGFEAAAPLGITLPLPSWAPVEAGQLRRLSAWRDGLSGRVVYPEAFDHLTE